MALDQIKHDLDNVHVVGQVGNLLCHARRKVSVSFLSVFFVAFEGCGPRMSAVLVVVVFVADVGTIPGCRCRHWGLAFTPSGGVKLKVVAARAEVNPR